VTRYIVETGNENAGADANTALTSFHVNDSTLSDADVASQLIAFMQYLSPGAGCYIRGITSGLDAPGPTMPIPFPTTEYAAIQAGDTNIIAMDSYGDTFGTGNLAPIGVGIVLTKRTALPGRTGRGRLVTPWLRSGAVSSVGVAVNENIEFAVLGWNNHIRGDETPSVDLGAYIWPSMANIIAVTGTARLGKLRTRSR
jgi:hypothetical protein